MGNTIDFLLFKLYISNKNMYCVQNIQQNFFRLDFYYCVNAGQQASALGIDGKIYPGKSKKYL